MTGVRAAVEWGYHEAAELGAWTIQHGYVRAAVVKADPIRIRQSPLWFTVDNSASGRPPFQRRLLEPSITDGWLTGRIGPRK